jgi:RluA family pseudouridine synthase
VRDFGLLHRLDRETSGLLVVALSAKAYDQLRLDFEERKIRKFYWAVCNKAPNKDVGLVNKPIAEVEPKRPGDKKLAIIASPPRGRQSETAYRVLAKNMSAALVECRPMSGRLHQVRVHMEAIGCSILGDGLYAHPRIATAAPRLALHAHRLAFTHPITGEEVDARSDFPDDLRPLIRRLKLPLPVA